ncbi:hypothetical protein EB093_09900 [bacterium]|nr:hypothetical protein [bacterium]
MMQMSDSVRRKLSSRILMAHNAFVEIADYADEKGLKSILDKAETNAERLLGVARYLEALGTGYYGGLKLMKNPRVYTGKLYPKIELAIDGNYVGTTAQYPSLKSALENLKEEFPMKKGKYLVAYYPGRPGMRRIKLKY